MKWNENSKKIKKDSVSKLLKSLFICSIFFVALMYNATIVVEGSFLLKEVNSSLLNEGERGTVLSAQDDFLYLYVENSSQAEEFADSLQITDVRQPESPIVVGRYELVVNDTLHNFQVKDNIAYMLIEKPYPGVINWTVTLLNITEPANPVLLGSSVLENTTRFSMYSWYLSIHNNYTYVSTDFELIIFDCSNPTSPVKVANHTSSGGETHITNDFLYIVSDGVKIFDLADPVNPVFLGEVNSTKHTSAGSGVYGSYVINVFEWFGIQVYNCTDPSQPTICWNYDFPKRLFTYEGDMNDIDIVRDRLYVVGNRIFVFDLSNPQNLIRVTKKEIGGVHIRRISVSENYIYLTIGGSIKVYTYVENFFGRDLGLGIGIGVGIPILIGCSLLILRKKKS